MSRVVLHEEAFPRRGEMRLDHFDKKNNRDRRTSLVEVYPTVYLLATVQTEQNVCVVSLLAPGPNTEAASHPTGNHSNNNVISQLIDSFKIPKTIQVIPKDEGTISTVLLIVDRNVGHSNAPDGGGSRGEKGGGLHVHLFLGTSTGCVLFCNALSGTVLAITQFLHKRSAFKDTGAPFDTEEERKGSILPQQQKDGVEGVTKLVAHRKGKELLYNPSIAVNSPQAAGGPYDTQGVYIVYEWGSVVLIPREILDVFIKVSNEKKDGRRPQLTIDWTPGQNAYPHAGSTEEFPKYIRFVYKLRRNTKFSYNENITSQNAATRYDEPTSLSPKKPHIRDADFFLFQDLDTLGSISEKSSTVTEALVICGREPAFSIYPLDPEREENTTARAVKAAVSFMRGMVKQFWYNKVAAGTVETGKKLEERPQLPYTGLMEGDSTFTSIKVDPTQQWAAFYCDEGAGRLYIVELSLGVVVRILKGCRAAQFHWWMEETTHQLLLVLHIPLRKVLEIHSLREEQRVTACHVPENVLLLPTNVTAKGPVLLTNSGSVIHLTLEVVKGDGKGQDRKEEEKEDDDGGSGAVGVSNTLGSSLRQCRGPIDFIRLTETFETDGTPSSIRAYQQKVRTVCAEMKRRFAPPPLDIQTIDFTCLKQFHNTVEDLDRLTLTATQAIHFLKNRTRLVKQYYDLQTSSVGKSVQSEPRLFCAEGGKTSEVSFLWARAVLATAVHLEDTDEIAILKGPLQAQCEQYITTFKGKAPNTTSPNCPSHRMDWEHYQRVFFCGSEYPSFCVSALYGVHSAAYYDELRQLSYLLFLPGLDVFNERVSHRKRLGLTMEEFSQMVFLYLCEVYCRDQEAFLLSTNLLTLRAIVNEFSEDLFIRAIQFIRLPFLWGDRIHPHLQHYCFILLLCLILRQNDVPIVLGKWGVQCRLTVGKLLRLYAHSQQAAHATSDPTDEVTSLSLSRLEMESDSTESDTMECTLLSLGCSSSVVDQVSQSLEKCSSGRKGVRYFKLWKVDRLYPLSNGESIIEKEWPWLKEGEWNSKVFEEYILSPLREAATADHSPSDSKSPLVFQCCALSIAAHILERQLSCFSNAEFSFWEDECVPSADFLTSFRVKEKPIKWLKTGSTTPFLQSTVDLIAICVRLAKAIFGEDIMMKNTSKVELIQCITEALDKDVETTFPAIPKKIRSALAALIDLLTSNDRNPVLPLQHQHALFRLLLFFIQCPSLKVNGYQILHLKNLTVPWKEMFGSVSVDGRYYIVKSVDRILLDDKRYFTQLLHRLVYTTVLSRRFIQTCIASCSFTPEEEVALLLSHDLKDIVNDLFVSTGLSHYLPPRCFTADVLVKRLGSSVHLKQYVEHTLKATEEQETMPFLAAVDWKLLVTYCLKSVRRHKTKGPNNESTIDSVEKLVSDECFSWLNQKSRAPNERIGPLSGNEWMSSTKAFYSSMGRHILNSSSWILEEEAVWLRENIEKCLSLPAGSAEKENLFDVILLLSTIAHQGASSLPVELQSIAEEFTILSLGLRNFL